MTTSRRSRTKKTASKVASCYKKAPFRTVSLSRLVDFVPGTVDPLDRRMREQLIGRAEWESYDTRKRNRAVGFVDRDHLALRHCLKPPMLFSRTPKNELLEPIHVRAMAGPQVLFRFKEIPITTLAPKHTLGFGPLVAMTPRLKTTPTEDLPMFLNSRLFFFYWRHYYPRRAGQPVTPAEQRLEAFQVPMLTKKTGGEIRKVRDRIHKLGRDNADRLARMDQVQKLADEAGITTIPIGQTEGIIREINVPKPLSDVAEVKRRGPVVIFRRGSTIVTTTEEAATYLEFWLKQRFDQMVGMTREDIEEYIRMPVSTADVVVVLQRRASIESEIEACQEQIDALQDEVDEHLFDLYALGDDERAYLRSGF